MKRKNVIEKQRNRQRGKEKKALKKENDYNTKQIKILKKGRNIYKDAKKEKSLKKMKKDKTKKERTSKKENDYKSKRTKAIER